MIFLILLLSVWFRFYRFPELFHWTMDEELWSYLPNNIATGYHFPLIGGHIAGTGLYSGPLFIYLMAIPAKIFSGNPLGFGAVVASIGILTTILIFFVGKRLFSSRVGVFSALLYSSSFLMAIFDRHYWNASLTPVLSLLTVWFIWEIWRKRFKFAIPLAVALALAFHAHGTGMALVFFVLLVWVGFRLPVRQKSVAISVGLFLLLQLPLVFFDLRHNFLNTRALTSYLASPSGQSVPLGERIENVITGFFNASSRLVYFPASDLAFEQTLGLSEEFTKSKGEPPVVLYPAVVLLIVFTLARSRKDPSLKLPLLIIASTLIGLLFYKEKIPEYFFNPTFPALFLLWGNFLDWSWQNRLAQRVIFCLLLVYLYINLNNLLTVKHSFGYATRLKVVQEIINRIDGDTFTLNATCVNFCQLYGFRYLFTYLGREPVSSYLDPNFLWLYEKRLAKVVPTKDVTIEMNDGQTKIYVSDRH